MNGIKICRQLELRKPSRFFRFLLGEFRETLPLPRAFVATIDEPEEWGTAIIRSNHLGRTWQIDVRGDGKDLRLTGNAWESFIQIHHLQRGDLLVFSQEGEAVFRVEVFDLSTCPKNYNNPLTLRDQRSCDPLDQGAPSSFFRVLLQDFHMKLPLPRAFVVAAEAGKWESATITSNPLGTSWRVEVWGDAEDVYFTGRAWKSLAQGHDLKIGYFLFFSYEGGTNFAIDVFDLNTCCKSYRSNPIRVEEDVAKANMPGKSKEGNTSQGGNTAEHRTGKKKAQPRRKTSVTADQFQLRINPSCYAYVPQGYLERGAIRWSVDHRVLLSNSQGIWAVVLRHFCDGKSRRTRFGTGWTAFKRANKLRAGSIYVFTLLSRSARNGVIFSVTKFRDLVNSTEKAGKSSFSKQHEAVDVLCRESKFHVEVSDRTKFRISVPRPLGMKYLLGKCAVTLQNNEKQRWRVRVGCYNRLPSRVSFYFIGGWLAFRRDNGLQPGDVCIFEVLNTEDVSMGVNIIRKR